MQLALIAGIVIAIGAVLFALQNNTPVSVDLATWHFEGSLALFLLLAVGIGVLIAGLLSSPTLIRARWTANRLRRQVMALEHKLAEQERRNGELSTAIAEAESGKANDNVAETVEEKPYVGLRALLTRGNREKSPPE